MGYLNIENDSIIYADTLIFIYTIEANSDYWELLQPLWSKSQQKEI